MNERKISHSVGAGNEEVEVEFDIVLFDGEVVEDMYDVIKELTKEYNVTARITDEHGLNGHPTFEVTGSRKEVARFERAYGIE